MLADKQDTEAIDPREIETPEKDKDFKTKYQDKYNDIKQPGKYIKEDW